MTAAKLTLVLLPGMDGTGELFAPFVAALADAFAVRVVRYPDDGPQTYAALAEHARAALPREGPYLLLGESFSGPIAVMLAATHPPGLVGVVLCASFVRDPRPALTRWLAPLAWLPLPRVPTAPACWALMGRHATPALAALLGRALGQVSTATLRARLGAVREVDASNALAQLRVPVLWLRATEDRLVSAAAAEHAARRCAMLTVVAIEAPHCLLQTTPHEAVRALQAFACGIMGASAIATPQPAQ